MKRIYISGPVTGTDDYEQRFSEAAALLQRQYAIFVIGDTKRIVPINNADGGIIEIPHNGRIIPIDFNIVVNPIEITRSLPVDTKWRDYIDITLAALRTCDAIYMLRNWEKSKGATIEKLYAEGSGMRIFYQAEQEDEHGAERE